MAEDKLNSDFKVDLVYLWVDGNDPVWRAKRDRCLGVDVDAVENAEVAGEARWRDNDELRYSLRSVEMFAPWINRIFIVTDGQRPAWLNTDHPKVRIVDHSEILDPEALPVFNSHAIESCIYKIPGLSEYFIVGNDDTIFSGEVSRSTFFHDDGRPIVRLVRFNRRKALKRSNYTRVIRRMQDLVYELTGEAIYYAPHHNFDAYRRSDFIHCVSLLPDRWHDTSYHRFRSDDDMQRCFVSLYCVATGRAEMCKVDRYNRVDGILGAFKAFFTNRYATDSRCIPMNTPNYAKVYSKYNPLMLCINDGEKTTDADRESLAEFMGYMFPNKSGFEL